MADHTGRPPRALTEAYPGVPGIIAEEYHPARGWRPYRAALHITPSFARKLRAEGVTMVSIRIAPGRRADFTTAELARR